jgi:hypothetical protein
MTEDAELNFNPPKLSPQCQKLYDRLLLGPITTDAIRDELRLIHYSRRFTDLKQAGIIWDKRYVGNNLYEYRLKKN